MKCGLITEERFEKLRQKKANIEKEVERLGRVRIKPTEEVNSILEGKGSSKISQTVKLIELVKRTELSYNDFIDVDITRPQLTKEEIEQIDRHIKYEGYIKLQKAQADKFIRSEFKVLPIGIDYDKLEGLRIEARQKLKKVKPKSIGQAARLSGVSPADVSVLMIYLAQYEGRSK